MKIKFIWELSDIVSGIYFIRQTSPIDSKDLSFACTVSFKLGFLHDGSEQPWVLISVLTDGMVYAKMANKEDVLNMLNNDEHGYRPLTKSEYMAMLESTDQGFIKKPII